MTPKETLKVLHDYQKWRRGGKGKQPDPKIIGEAIGEAIRIIRKMENKTTKQHENDKT